jgi:hypothetical protein
MANFRTHAQSFRLHDHENFRIAYSNYKKAHLVYIVIDKHKGSGLQSMACTETNIIGRLVVYSFMLIYSFLLAGRSPLVGSSTLHLVLRFAASFLRYADHRCQVLWYMDSSVIYASRLANFMLETSGRPR